MNENKVCTYATKPFSAALKLTFDCSKRCSKITRTNHITDTATLDSNKALGKIARVSEMLASMPPQEQTARCSQFRENGKQYNPRNGYV